MQEKLNTGLGVLSGISVVDRWPLEFLDFNDFYDFNGSDKSFKYSSLQNNSKEPEKSTQNLWKDGKLLVITRFRAPLAESGKNETDST